MFINRSLRRQLFAGFAAVTTVLLVGLAVGWLSIGAVDRQLADAEHKQAALAAAGGDARDMATTQVMVVISANQIADHRADVATFRRTLATLGRYSTTPDTRADVRRTRALFVRWAAIDDRIVNDSRLGVAGRAEQLMTAQGDPAMDRLTKAVTELSTAISRADTTAADTSTTHSRDLMLVLAVAALALVAVIASTMTRKLVRRITRLVNGIRQLDEGPLEQLRNGLQALAGGDLTVALRQDQETIPTRRSDEIGDLIRSFNAMGAKTAGATEAYETARRKVSEMLREIGRTSHTLSATSEQMADVSMQTGHAVDEIAGAVGSVAEGAEHQVRAISAARQLTEEVALASESSASGAAATAAAAARARELAQEGSRVVGEVIVAMQEVQASTSELTGAIHSLDSRSGQIGQIVDTISAIADQTNLLALNAAIEAARAGESGRGFAVVAEEVRKLAEQSQSAAASIGDLIAGIQAQTRQAVALGEAGAQRTEAGYGTVREARDAFERIAQAVTDMDQRVAEIGAAIHQIAGSGARMQESMSAVASIAEQSSAASEQASASTEQTSASVQVVAASAGDLAGTARQLQELVDQFSVSDAPPVLETSQGFGASADNTSDPMEGSRI
jgi:methyl-accepting chemotaxis protein